jgi:predicted nucleic acid-binding protein
MMRVLVDTNIALEWFLQREPWFSDQSPFWQALEVERIFGSIPASAVTDVFYIARRLVGTTAALGVVRDCLAAFRVIAVTRSMLVQALALSGSDFQDNLQIICARTARLDAIVTRDREDFRGANIPSLTPAEAIDRLNT